MSHIFALMVLLLCSHGPASLLSSSIAPSSRLLCCSYVKGIRALCEASLLCRIERNRSHDDESHRRALDVRDVRIYLPVIRISSLRG
jgi:hypothetical protein